MSDSPSFTRALAGYDDAFRERLLIAISRTIATESVIIEGDTRVMALADVRRLQKKGAPNHE